MIEKITERIVRMENKNEKQKDFMRKMEISIMKIDMELSKKGMNYPKVWEIFYLYWTIVTNKLLSIVLYTNLGIYHYYYGQGEWSP